MKQTALITGASSGIGYEMAKVFARNGYDLVLVARNTGKLQALAAELNGTEVIVLGKDLSLPQAPGEIYEELAVRKVQVDVLVNNAGFGDFGLFHETDLQKQLQMVDLNVRALTELTHRFGRDMVARRSGRILNVASTAAFFSGPLMSVYYATKNYVLAFSEGIANEWKSFGVTVTALCPGGTESGFQAAAAMEESKLVKGKKLPTSAEVAEYGYRALMQGKTTAIHGFGNCMQALAPRFLPRKFAASLVRSFQERSR